MGKSSLVITGDVQDFLNFTDIRLHSAAIRREMRRATIKSSRFLIKQVKKTIRSRRFTPNSELTLALAKKGGSRRSTVPLRKFQILMKAMMFELKSAFESEVGLIKDTQTTGGVTGDSRSLKKVAFLLHEGYTITVTDAMRAAIAIELRKINDRRSRRVLRSMESRTGHGKGTFRVPPRRFFTTTFRNPVIQKVVKKNWKEAIERALSSTSGKKVKGNG